MTASINAYLARDNARRRIPTASLPLHSSEDSPGRLSSTAASSLLRWRGRGTSSTDSVASQDRSKMLRVRRCAKLVRGYRCSLPPLWKRSRASRGGDELLNHQPFPHRHQQHGPVQPLLVCESASLHSLSLSRLLMKRVHWSADSCCGYYRYLVGP